ncbi:histone-lysine N-methyltransferase SETMAR [Trichonephila clavata]|uniref:Histone-lysine N-methyltransferase SETMAR n=1 Tax=Trichonephila clavata TaxID=2740835 RepID=A0A8X6HCZ6_TRICU|nr:histone-lysine N-methyltransferase SETMAR [Trichonephila clavata]
MFIDDISNNQEKFKVSFINEINDLQLPTFVIYVTNSVLGSESLTEEFESLPLPCNCESLCKETCACSAKVNMYLDGKLSESYNNSIGPIVECSDFCTCISTCPNRVVQHGLQFSLDVFLTERTGFGVRSKEFIPKYSFVCEYAGEIIDEHEAELRLKKQSSGESNYIYVIKEHISNNKCIKTIIDPTFVGNVGRYLNHSCSPNLFSVPVRVGSMIPKVCFFAKENILPLVELTYNYGEKCTADGNSSKCARKCQCQSLNCCGYLPFVDENWIT